MAWDGTHTTPSVEVGRSSWQPDPQSAELWPFHLTTEQSAKAVKAMEGVTLLVALLTSLLQCSGLLAFLGTPFRALDNCRSGYADPGNGMASLTTRSVLGCVTACSGEAGCVAVNVCTNATTGVFCRLLRASTEECSQLQAAPACSYIAKRCVHGTWDGLRETCQCQQGFAGSACQRLLRDCTEGYDMGLRGWNTNYTIQPLGSSRPFSVFCFFETGLTIVLRRDPAQCPSTQKNIFLKTWGELQGQSGDCNCECFAGLDNIRILLRQRTYCLKVFIKYNGQMTDTYYNNATLGDEASRYSLSIAPPREPYYTMDGLLPGGNRKFCTLDNDCGGCAASAGHAGWFDDSGGAPCPEAQGFGAVPQWPMSSGTLQNLSVYSWELHPQCLT